MATMVNPQQPHMTEAKVSPPEGSFDQFAALCRNLFEQRMAEFGPHLFVVEFEKDELNNVYLDGFADAGMRQHHNCSACRHFIERYGRLAFVKDGQLIPAIWPMGKTVDGGLYAASAEHLYRAVQTGKISGVFLSKLAVLGTPISFDKVTNQPIWSHFAMNNPSPFKHTVDSAGQRMALKREHFGTMFRAVIDYGADVVKQALALCEGDTLYRTDKVSGPLKFLLQAIERLAPHPVSSPAWNNVLWQIVAEGNPAQLTPRSSMTGTLLDDLLLVNKGEMTLDKAKARFADKMAPLNYMRPKAAPSSGQIAEANKLAEKLGIIPSLERRFARLDEVPKIWEPQKLLSFSGKWTDAAKITFEKFRRTVLPNAQAISVEMGYSMALGSFATAVHADAPPIHKWDREDARNPLSWYLYIGGSSPSAWGLKQGDWVPCVGIALRPELMGKEQPDDGDRSGAMFLLQGAEDKRNYTSALFPESMRHELHPVRKTIEQFSKSHPMTTITGPHAAGLIVGKSNGEGVRLRVETANGPSYYTIDRWD